MKYLGAMVGALVVGWATPASADGFGEVIAGVAAPLGDDDYDAAVDASFRLGVRAGAIRDREGSGARLGFELGVDWTPLSSDIDLFMEESFHRVRFLVGLRALYDVSDQVSVVGRFAGGIDYTRAAIEVLGTEVSEDSIGIALDPSVAVQAAFGTTSVGLQIGFPIGIQDEQGDNFDIDYTSVDLDLLLVLTARM